MPEPAAREREEDFCRPPEDPDVRVWRYMALERFESMLEEHGLFFARSHLFEDQREGSATHRQAWSRLPSDFNLPDGRKVRIPLGERMAEMSRWNRQWVCISYWHMNETESAAMWKLYAQSEKAVCVQSTFRRLRDTLREYTAIAPWPIIGVVRYIDHSTDVIPSQAILAPYFHKPREYAHERELRAVFWDLPSNEARQIQNDAVATDNGIWYPIEDFGRLIERVYVAPGCPQDTAERVRTAMRHHALEAPLIRSSLESAPVY